MNETDSTPETLRKQPIPIREITDDPYVYMRDSSGVLWFVWDNPTHIKQLQRLGWTQLEVIS